MVLRIEGLKTYFHTYEGSVKALEGIDLEIRAGETVGLVGETGCGKSVTALSALRLIPSPPGKIEGGRVFLEEPAEVHALRAEYDALAFERLKKKGVVSNVTSAQVQEVLQPEISDLRSKVNPAETTTEKSNLRLRLQAANSEYDILQKSEDQLRGIRGDKISMIFQEPMTALNPVFTIGDQIAETLILHRRQELCRDTLRSLERQLSARGRKSGRKRLSAWSLRASSPELAMFPLLAILGGFASVYLGVLLLTDTSSANNWRLLYGFGSPGPLGLALALLGPFEVCAGLALWRLYGWAGRFVSLLAVVLILLSIAALSVPGVVAAVIFLVFMFDVGPDLAGATAICGRSFSVSTAKRILSKLGSASGQDRNREDVLRRLDKMKPDELVCGFCFGRTLPLWDYCPNCGVRISTDLLAHFRGRIMTLETRLYTRMLADPHDQLVDFFSSIRVLRRLVRNRLRKEGIRWAVDMLQGVRIAEPERIAGQYPFELSGGMRQRSMIAMMMACNPKLLIADEPTTALDVTVEAQILKLMKELQARTNMAILLITHDLGIVAEVCDKVGVMYAGSIAEFGTTEQVFHRMMHPYTNGLMQSIPRFRGAASQERKKDLYIIKGSVPNLLHPPPGCRFHPRCPRALDKCKEVMPPLVEMEAGHLVACHNPVPRLEVAA